MKKTLLFSTLLLSGSLFAQEKTFQSGKGHNCISISRGCLNSDGNNSITFNIESVQKDRIMFSISTNGLSEEDQFFLTGGKLENGKENAFFSQEEDYFFTEQEKNVLTLKGEAFLKKDKYPVRIMNNKLYLEIKISYN